MNQIEEPEDQNPLGPADHFPEYQNMDVDDDPDPEMPPSGTPTHPIILGPKDGNNAPAIDPYIEAANYNALYPGPFPATYPTRYPAYGYQYPPPPQPQQQQPPQPQIQQPQQQEILQRLHEVEQRVDEELRSRRGLLKGLASLIKGKKKSVTLNKN
ncbi:alpha/beta-gliadin A-IV-like [Helianthus annuus]|uniref:alpha/beta-gliadin A-IV-like n=1 Tax=Helianthus annuus TaxID=4232 RepID=UPI000B8F9388|nr:alpha/beta-gliadin A-IV-like [Helianthus annuus]